MSFHYRVYHPAQHKRPMAINISFSSIDTRYNNSGSHSAPTIDGVHCAMLMQLKFIVLSDLAVSNEHLTQAKSVNYRGT